MTLATELLDAGWREFREGEKWVAERFHSRPGATASTIRVEAPSSRELNEAIKLRQSQLQGTEAETADVITNDGTLVTGPQHEALRAEGVTVAGAEQVKEPVPNEDEAKQVAPFDATEGSIDAPQVPADAADQGLPPEAVSASETGSGSADTSTEPSAQAQPATFPPPEGQLSPEDSGAARADAESSDEQGSQNTPSADGENESAVEAPVTGPAEEE